MMGMIWVVFLVALTGTNFGGCLPVRPSPQTYPHDVAGSNSEGWSPEGGVYTAVPALALILTAVSLLIGCTWCYRHKDCKLFTATATHIHDGRRAHPPDSGFSEPVNNNISEDNNNGPISLREMQNIANNNATAYIVTENEDRNRVSRESVVEFEPLPSGIRVVDPLERCTDWFGDNDFPRSGLQYLREIGRGWFGRVVEGEIENVGTTSTVAVKILNQNASLEDKARFLDEAKVYRDVRHENVLTFLAKCVQEDPWILIFELCSMDLQQYLITNRPIMTILNEAGVPLRLMCDYSSALAHLHSRGYIYGNLWSGSVLVRGDSENARGVLGRYAAPAPPYDFSPPETRSDPSTYTASSDTWCLGALLYELSASGAPPCAAPPPAPAPFRDHLYQVMQLCWNPQPEYRPSSAQVHALVRHLHSGGGPASCDFELRWQRLKPNTVAVLDEHVAIVHAPSVTSPLARSDGECPPPHDSLSVDMDTAVSRSSSIMSDKDPLSVQIKSESLTNLHGSLEDVRNIYLTHNETATLECHQGNIALDEAREREQDRSDSSVDPWLKEIIAGSQDDVSYYKDVSDVIKNLDNILNSEKTSSSESSHQASPSRDNLSLDCKKNYPVQSSLVKSPGITDFQNILDTGFSSNLESQEICEDDDRDTIGTLSHSFERHSDDTTSQHTLENLTPDTPVKDIEVPSCGEVHLEIPDSNEIATIQPVTVLPNEHNLVISDSKIPKLKKLCAISISNASDIEHLKVTKDCQTSCDSNLKEIIINKEETKSVDVVGKLQDVTSEIDSKISSNGDIENGIKEKIVLPVVTEDVASKVEMILDKSLHSELPILQLELNRMDKTIVPSVSPVEEEISDLIKATEKLEANKPKEHRIEPSSKDFKSKSPEHTPEPVQRITNEISANILIESEETEITSPLLKESETTLTILPPEEVQNIITDDNCVLKPQLQNIILADEQNTEIVQSIDNKVVSDKVLSIEQSLVTEDNFGPIKSNGSFHPVEVVKKKQPVVNAKSLQDDYIVSNLKFLVEEQKHASQNHVLHNNVHFVLSNGLPEALCNDLQEVSETATYALAKCPTEIQKDCHNTSNEAVHTSCNNLNTVITDDIHNSVENVVCQDENNHLNVASCSDLQQNVKESNGDKKIVETQNLYNVGDEIEATAKLEHILQRISEVDIPKSTVTPNEVQVQISNNEESKISKDHIQEIIDNFHSNINVNASENTVDQSNGIASVTDSINLINSQKEHSTSLLKTVDEIPAQTEAETQKEYNATSTGINLKSYSDNELTPQIANEVSTYSEAQKIIDQATIITECQAFVPKRLDSNQANVSKSEALTEEKAESQDFQEDSILSQETDDAIEEAIRLVDEHFTSIITESPTQISDEITQESNFPNKSNSINEFETVTSKDIGNIVSSNSIDLDPTIVCIDKNVELKSENLVKTQSDESTAYMDLTNNTNNKIPTGKLNSIENLDFDGLIIDKSPEKDDSTKYLDLPSIRETDNFIHMEKIFNSNNIHVVSSTPLASDSSTDINNTIENPVKENDAYLSETNIPDYEGLTLTKLEQRYVPDNLSPFESPTKSHHTDTYDENSSVVLGPFENCTLELFRAVKSTELIDLPKEELLAFSSNFSEINLETPSPLRDVNFLNEVPDLVNDDIRFDDIKSISEKVSEPQTDTESQNSGTEKRVSPSTPPNSPGVFLASTSQVKYLVDIDLAEPLPEISTREIEQLSHIEQQMTSKLAMAENENNLNLEYSGPLVIEGLDSLEDEGRDDLEESYLAGNGGYVEDLREQLRLDEESVRALRNELELKLPLAQVAAIEPPSESEWSSELPPPPELIVNYPRALSPITEETGPQLSAYENDINWNASIRTDSSESYPEPCNNSTDEVTELPTGAHHSTYTLPTHSPNNTYTLQRDVPTSREMTMSADSLNASPYKKIVTDDSPIDDKTYTKEEERESLERISQVSPFLLSPTTDTSAPEHSDNIDNATGVSTLSKTTLPTDAKHSKPSETQCLSKATSIDSWCSNDTLYNVEENFDDLAMDPDLPQFEPEKEKEEENSESTDTLTHNEDDKEHSHCSTYIIHDSKSEACETFSPDSITANDNYTYTKAKTDNAGTTPSNVTTELNDSKTKDLAYGTLMSGVPSYSNCTTEVVSGFEDWKVAQPELVRKTPKSDDVDTTITKLMDEKISDISSPQLASEHSLKKIDSVEISCLQDNTLDTQNKTGIDTQGPLIHDDSPKYNYKNMAPSVTSTPITDHVEDDNVDPIPMVLPEVKVESSEESVNFQNFFQSAEVRPQDLSSNTSQYANTDTEILLMGDSKSLSKNSNRDSIAVSDRTSTYSDFENSAITKPQDSKDKSSQSIESAISSEDFHKFEDSVKSRPQDLSSLIDASSLLLKSERISAELGMSSLQNSQSASRIDQSEISPPNDTNLNESHSLVNLREPAFLINFSAEDDTEQPHSIIVTETTIDALKDNSNRTFDSYPNATANYGYNTSSNPQDRLQQLDTENGEILPENNVNFNETSHSIPKMDDTFLIDNTSGLEDYKVQSNGSEKFATVQFLNETFEELIESNVDEGDKDLKSDETSQDCGDNPPESLISLNTVELDSPKQSITNELTDVLAITNGVNDKVTVVTEDFLQNEKKFCQLDSYLPLMSDIRFTGPASEIMSTSFTEHSPTEPNEPKSPDLLASHNIAADILKEWDSDSDSHTSNSSSGEFIWKDGDGLETSVVPTTHFEHQRSQESQNSAPSQSERAASGASGVSGGSGASGSSGSGSEGDEVEFVPSSWDCRAAPAKSSLRSLEQTTPDNKKRVVFKRQKYHCVYEYPREVADVDAHSPAYLPDLSTYAEWDPSSAADAELGYGQLFGGSPLDLYPLRAGIAFGPDYGEDFFISSSARPFESLGIMSTTSQFFPGKHIKPSILERDLSDDLTEEFPPPPSPLPPNTLTQTRTPSLDFTTPDSGVEDITPGSTLDEDFKKKIPESELTWRPVDSASSSESVSPSSPGGEALGGLRHTRDKLKLDLPPSPHIPSPRHNRVFNFVLDKPKRKERTEENTPVVMTDETPVVTSTLPLPKVEDIPVPEPTFSTFGKSPPKVEPEQKLILTDDEGKEVKVESPKEKSVVEAVKGEGTVLDSGDEDSGIESSSKATLERKTNIS